MEHVINILKDFTATPGSRYMNDGDYSGEEFRTKFIEPLFEDPKDNSKITIILDGTEGYATSFLEETFGGLARKFGKQRCIDRLEFISEEDKLLIEEIKNYIINSDK